VSRGAGRATTLVKPDTGNGVKPAPRQARRQPVVAHDKISSGDKHLEWIPVALMRISEVAQRRHDTASSIAKIDDITRHFDPDKFGTLTVNFRDGTYWVIDGGHRYLSVIQLGWEDQLLQCWTYKGLSEAEEADKFLALNDTKPVSGLDKYKQGVIAGREAECDIDRIVRAADLSIGGQRDGIGCVGAVQKIYSHAGPEVLAATLRIIRDSFGMPGFAAKVTEGVGSFVEMYGVGGFNESVLIARLAAKRGGVNGLKGEAERLKLKYDISVAHAIAVAVVETYNRGKSGPRLATWWSMNSGTN
jgi:hypothetical protein